MRIKFGVLEQTQGLGPTLTRHISSVFIVSASGGQKPQFWANFDIWGLLYRRLSPIMAEFGVQQQTHSVRLRAKFRLDWFILSASGGEKTPFLPFFGLRHLVMSTVGGNLRKLNTGAQTTSLPLSNGIKIVSVVQRIHGEIRRTNSDIQKCEKKQTNKKLTVFGPPRRLVKSEPHQTWHGDRGPRARSCTSKTFGV